ncbi:MAG: bifunctional nuclease family protein [Paludibacteraceae bacterium]|nr:bifunctional nuclease family protein [Paludibacteraceae bacterium]
MIELYVFGISIGVSKTETHTLMLKEITGSKYLMVEIGHSEAQSIALQLESLVSPRPLTHDVILSLTRAFEIDIERVVINKILEKVFFSELVCRAGNRILSIDCRTSDAVAISLRSGCPIYIEEHVLEEAMEQRLATQTKQLSDMTEEELTAKMQAAANREEYKQAMKYKQELMKRNNNTNTQN